ncbi:tyrosine-type recombinase/integrase [Xanthobacter sp. V7C-4]|uniref:tyrosine-type recombinase/integrase n=1 Tax=Xanthobacter autotrophicus (strain ATCC BAA-1158 / Py2) TaxID=78245 RepID=UPI003729AA4A
MGPRLKLPRYIHGFLDRHGKPRYYLRRPGCKQVALPGIPFSPEFMAAYAAGMADEVAAMEIGASRSQSGTVAALVASYLSSGQFRALAGTTQQTYRGIIEGVRSEHGEKRVAMLQREHVARLISKKADTPAAANNLLRMLRTLMQFAVDQGWRKDDPTFGVKPIRTKSEGFYTWTEQDIAKFEEHHPAGKRARLAFALLLYTAQRRGDVVRMGRQHIRNGVLTIRQEKTGTLVELPVLPELQAIIDATPNEHMTFLVTEHGKPFTSAGFGNLFRDWCRQAGVPEACSAHGLRKAASRRLAEAGCTAHEIMAITGHKTLKEVTRYTAAVDRKRLGVAAMAKIREGTSRGKPE